jgi:hypothetical protein
MPTKRATKQVAKPPDIWEGESYVKYVDTIELPDHMTLADIETFIEKVRGIGSATWLNRTVTVELRGFTEWDLREQMNELVTYIEEYVGLVYEPSYSKVTRVGQAAFTERLINNLRHLRDDGYQPSYNGRPSCPFCGNFVDDEETHDPKCVLLDLVLEH